MKRAAALAPMMTIAALVASAADARAQAHDKDPCISAYEETQVRRKDGKLLEASRDAAICARAECPAVLAKDCTKWRGELEAAIPSIIVEASIPNARLTVDGAVAAEKLDGKAIPLDPGSHTLRVEATGYAPADRVVVLREGEKNRKIAVALGDTNARATDSPDVTRPIPLGVWLFGGASLVALAVSGVFAIDGLAKKSDLDACKPHCPSGDVDAMSASFTVSDVALGAGLALGLATAWLYVTRPKAEPTSAERAERARRVTVVPLVERGSAGAAATVRF